MKAKFQTAQIIILLSDAFVNRLRAKNRNNDKNVRKDDEERSN